MTMKLNDFPTEIMLHIFSFIIHLHNLTKLRRVCKRWKELAFDRSLLREIVGHGPPPVEDNWKMTDEVLQNVIAHAGKITSLDLFRCRHISDQTFMKACSLGKLTWLKEVRIPYTSVTDNSVELIATAARKIQVLEIHGCPNITTLCGTSIRKMSSLEGLTLPKEVSSEQISNIANECRYITRLETAGILRRTDFKSIIVAIGSKLQYFLAPYALIADEDIALNASILKGMKALCFLCLCGTDITPVGKQFLESILPQCEICIHDG